MAKLVETRKIDADALTVFDCIRDDRMIRAWTPRIEQIEWQTSDCPERPTGLTASIVMLDQQGRPQDWTLTITRSRVPDRVVHVWSRDGLELAMRFDLTPMDDQTCLTVTIEPEQMDFSSKVGMVLGGASALKACLVQRVDRLSRLAQDAARAYRADDRADIDHLQPAS
ncbi:MAG: hypothetical protein Alpg2KO_04000 [Alphaproteobacteria bacterium]